MTKMALGLGVVALVVGASAIVATPQTIEPIRPGEMTKGRVWVENRGGAEAIPVDLRESNLDAPLRVHIVNAEPGSTAPNPVAVRQARPAWEYEVVTVAGGADVAANLNAQGAAGWETTGLTFPSAGGTLVLLKRLR